MHFRMTHAPHAGLIALTFDLQKNLDQMGVNIRCIDKQLDPYACELPILPVLSPVAYLSAREEELQGFEHVIVLHSLTQCFIQSLLVVL